MVIVNVLVRLHDITAEYELSMAIIMWRFQSHVDSFKTKQFSNSFFYFI